MLRFPRPEQRLPAIVLGLALALLLLAVLGSWFSEDSVRERERAQRIREARASAAPLETPVEVDALVVQRRIERERVELSGVLEALRSTWVASEIAGRVVEVVAEEHARVAKGEVLLRLDPALPEANLLRARAAHRLRELELERQERLSQAEVGSAAQLDRARAEEQSARAALREAQTQLARATLRAPFDGIVNTLALDPGAYLDPGTRVAQVLDVSRVEVTVLVSDRQIGALRRGQEASVRVDALGGDALTGRVVRVGRAPKANGGRYPVVLELPNPDGALLPGMLAQVGLVVGEAEAMRVPARALVHEFELDYVFVVDAASGDAPARARRVRVTAHPIPFRPEQREIRAGLAPGDTIAVSNVTLLRDGAPVRVRMVQGEARDADETNTRARGS